MTTLRKGDHVIPLYTPECRQCPSCLSRKTNLCTAIRTTQGQGLMPDGTSRFSCNGERIFHYMGCSTFSNFTVLPEIAVAKVNPGRALRHDLLHRLRRHDGHWRGHQHRQSRAGRDGVVFGLGGIGLNVIQGLRLAGADMIIGVDLNDAKKPWGERFGMTHFVNPAEVGGDLVPYLVNLTNAAPTRSAAPTTPSTVPATPPSCVRRWNPRIAAGASRSSSASRARAGDLDAAVPARHRPGLEGHGLRRRARPHRRAEDRRLVSRRQDRDRPDDHRKLTLDEINKGFDLMHAGEGIRSVVVY